MPNKITPKSIFLLAAFTLFSTLLFGCVGYDVQARKWNATDSCWGHEQDAGTYNSWFSGCDDSEAIAKDSKGNYPSLKSPQKTRNAFFHPESAFPKRETPPFSLQHTIFHEKSPSEHLRTRFFNTQPAPKSSGTHFTVPRPIPRAQRTRFANRESHPEDAGTRVAFTPPTLNPPAHDFSRKIVC